MRHRVRKGKLGLNMLFIGFLAYTTAFMETKTIEGFDYWEFQNRDRALLVGSVVYMIYFIVSFPKFLQVDEEVKSSNRKVKSIKDDIQLQFFNLDSPVLEELKDEISKIDINSLTPVEALLKLSELKKKIDN